MTGEVLKPGAAPAWIIEQVTVMAEAFGIGVTEARLKIYADALCDIARDALAQAIDRALRECKFFPTIAELLELAGASQQQQAECEASAMWENLCRFVARHYYHDLGGLQNANALPPRVAYAMRRIGGAQAVANRTLENEPFMKRDFIVAYNNFPVYEQMRPQLEAAWPGEARRKLPATTAQKPALPAQPQAGTAARAVRILRSMPKPMSAAERQARKTLLDKQARQVAAKYGAAEVSTSAAGCERPVRSAGVSD